MAIGIHLEKFFEPNFSEHVHCSKHPCRDIFLSGKRYHIFLLKLFVARLYLAKQKSFHEFLTVTFNNEILETYKNIFCLQNLEIKMFYKYLNCINLNVRK